jgi:DNA-binding NarL/FixJ family response regulator
VDNQVAVLTVDDQTSFRSLLREVIDAAPGFRLVGEAASGETALDAVETLSPRLVIMDKRMPGMNGIEACRLLTERHPVVVVVITSVEDPDPTVKESCGAAAFVRKQDLSPRWLTELWRGHRAPA